MAHIHELIDYTVEVYTVYQNKVILRFHDKYAIWLPPGGHVELNETPDQAAIREVKEEVGLDIELVGGEKPSFPTREGNGRFKSLIPPVFMNLHTIGETHRHIALMYFARAKNDIVKVLGDDRSDIWMWLTRDELIAKEDVMEDVKYYALAALDRLASK